ncbi:FAD-binding oxidoreductase [Desulforegula conservatrix]|uniref:FAD-binding oxidoreductase n=1 Tax=Desulforegula conservatrix TaxID=153026 RepID=UPI0003FA75B2|nr:FAD-binding oxidoreductase [Desulforegula conservatrix]
MIFSKKFEPSWTENQPPKGSYRSIFKWGAPERFKHPNARLYNMLKEVFGMTDNDFVKKVKEGNEQVCLPSDKKSLRVLTEEDLKSFISILGKENVETDDFSRVKFSSGKTVEEALELRDGCPVDVSDAVLHPRTKEDVQKVITYCSEHKIPVYVFGGGSSVNLGLRPSRGGITLVMSTHMKRLIELNEENQTATVEAGMMGPDFEKLLNKAPEKLSARRRYTCGHFPQSFEYSSVGGWVAALGSGQSSTYYGDACDLVISQEYVTPAGTFKTVDYPATATGPNINWIMMGSEGCFGVLTSVTMKIFRHMPENRKRFGYIFPDWDKAVSATREISQGEFGLPSVLRISDAEETDVALKLYGVEGTVLDKMMELKGFEKGRRCLCIGHTEGEKGLSSHVKRKLSKIARANGGMTLTGYPTSKWEHGRFNDPYMREDLNDYDIIIDTLETSVKWDNLHHVHKSVREFIKKRPATVCMTHCSHFYPQGTNLYFIFIGRFSSMQEYKNFQTGIIERINASGGSLSHHHGVGKMIGPWMESHLGKEQIDILKALKRHFDPENIMNPGGQMSIT